MFVALDATYLVDPHPSGIAVYSRELLDGLARTHPNDEYIHLYRMKQFRRCAAPAFANVRNRLLLPVLPPTVTWKRPGVFHALNQRVDQYSGKCIISTFHDLFVMTGEYSSAEFRTRFAGQARQAAKRSDVIIAVSEFTRDQVITHLNIDSKRVRVVPHGVHMPVDPPALSQREKIILCVGALQLRKNVTRLVEAFERLPEKLSKDWKLVLAGSTAGYGAAAIINRIEHSPKLFQIQLRGYVSSADLKDLYRRASIFAFPSLDEGFGIPVLEAMANGIPVVTSNRSALPQVAGHAALLANPYDSDDIAQQLTRLMEDEALQQKLRALGIERAKLFPWEKAVQSTYEIYCELSK